MTRREFNQDVSTAKRIATESNLICITHQGKPAHVLLTIKEYEKIANKNASIIDFLAMPE